MAPSFVGSSGGGAAWRFALRPGVKFWNGDPMTSEDVKFSLDRLININLKGPIHCSRAVLDGMIAAGSGKIQVTGVGGLGTGTSTQGIRFVGPAVMSTDGKPRALPTNGGCLFRWMCKFLDDCSSCPCGGRLVPVI